MRQYIKYFLIFCGLLLIGVSFFIDTPAVVAPKVDKKKVNPDDRKGYEDAKVVEEEKTNLS